MTVEIWKDIKGYEGYYQVSNLGRVRSLDRVCYQRHYSGVMSRHYRKGRIIKGSARGGRKTVLLAKNGEEKTFPVSRLVALHFIPNPNNYPVINRLDANTMNNRADNLEWCTQSHNIQYAYDNGTKIPPHMRKVKQYDLNGNYIRTWDSMAEAARSCKGHCNIYKVCIGKRNQAGGYKWEYA